ncbi:hypothetical protein H6G51_01330 [Limnothrix sp. FACHB-708]|uniref:Uncharacterized protein n=1 Tax=Limnothrix redekei LRLZ20PSL1 TaxID=3112953 RepID=A0ABW7CA47_9CYAN|nr:MULTISPECIES: hypothetical protein [unclassified Limnothrix]MBD2551909.1 hypothetical protein [Limnothrix sp. FACHB-708]MBD2589588.1 hypothetical protein [Limnothrix sp. FACHB-406]
MGLTQRINRVNGAACTGLPTCDHGILTADTTVAIGSLSQRDRRDAH